MDAGTEANIAWRARLDRGRRRPRVGPRLITDHEVQAPCQRGSTWSARAGRGPRTPFLAAGLRGGKKLHLSAKGRRHDKVLESGLEQRFSTVVRHYEITVEKAGANATAVRFSHRRQDNAGACAPATRISRPSSGHGYRGHLPFIEIRARIAPGQRIAAHLLIAVLAAVHLIPARGIDKCRTSIRESMRNQGHHAPARIDRQPTGHAPPGSPKSPRRLVSNPPHEEPPHKDYATCIDKFREDFAVDASELRIPVQMLAAFQRLAVGLKAVPQIVEQPVHRALADAVALDRKTVSASRAAQLYVQRSELSGLPRVIGSSSRSSAATNSGSRSVTRFRPPPGRRKRPEGTSPEDSETASESSSFSPARTVPRDIPVASTTRAMPRRPMARASVAAHRRRARSSGAGRNTTNFRRPDLGFDFFQSG